MKEKSFKIIGLLFLSIFIAIFIFLIFLTMNYPIKFKNEIKNSASKYSIPAYVVASVINVESSFNENAISNKGAVGLMQILPSTGEWLAKKLNIDNFNSQMLSDPSINIELGSYYLRYLLDKFSSLDTALCAYNAGEGTISNWLNDKNYSQDGKALSNIPFKETREYLDRVKNNYKFYKLKIS